MMPPTVASDNAKLVQSKAQPTAPVNINIPLFTHQTTSAEPTKAENVKSEPENIEPTVTPVPLKLDPLPEWVQT